jgi:hypothetical protein
MKNKRLQEQQQEQLRKNKKCSGGGVQQSKVCSSIKSGDQRRAQKFMTALPFIAHWLEFLDRSKLKVSKQHKAIIQQSQKNKPILDGDTGVGKTAIVEGLA